MARGCTEWLGEIFSAEADVQMFLEGFSFCWVGESMATEMSFSRSASSCRVWSFSSGFMDNELIVFSKYLFLQFSSLI